MAKSSGLGSLWFSETITLFGVEMATADVQHLLIRLNGHDPLRWHEVVPLLTVDDLRWIDRQLSSCVGLVPALPPRVPDLIRV